MHTIFPLIAMLLFLLAFPSGASAETPVRLAFLSDLHFISPELTDNGEYFTKVIDSADGKVTRYCDQLTQALVEQLKSSGANAIILQGDLTFNGAVQSHTALREHLQVLRDTGIPVYVLPGNHDVYNRNAALFEGDSFTRVSSVTSEVFESIWHDFGFSDAISCDDASLSYVIQLSDGMRLLMVDTNTEGNIGRLLPQTLAWVEKQLVDAEKESCRVIAVSHQNLYAHNPIFISQFQIDGAEDLKKLYLDHNVIINISGHMHAQHMVNMTGPLPEIACSSVSVQPCQYGMLTLFQGQLEYHTVKTDVSTWAAHTRQTDSSLLNFGTYAIDYFAANCVRQFRSTAEAISSTDTQRVLSYIVRLNTAFFAGNLERFSLQDEIFRLILSKKDLPAALYIQSLKNDLGKNYTSLHYRYGGQK